MQTAKGNPLKGVLGGILLHKISKIEVLRNGLSGILQLRKCVIII